MQENKYHEFTLPHICEFVHAQLLLPYSQSPEASLSSASALKGMSKAHSWLIPAKANTHVVIVTGGIIKRNSVLVLILI